MTETYKIPQGKIVIQHYNKNISIGLLVLNPNQRLSKHNRPVDEELVQIAGTSIMEMFDNEIPTENIELKPNKRIVIPANQFHIHSNPTDEESITLWKFEGDIVKIIEKIRESNEEII